jgi:hypothetical protein
LGDEQVGHGVPNGELAAGIEPLEHQRVLAVLQRGRAYVAEDRLPRQAHVQGGEVVAGVERADQLALHDWVILAVQHVLFACP